MIDPNDLPFDCTLCVIDVGYAVSSNPDANVIFVRDLLVSITQGNMGMVEACQKRPEAKERLERAIGHLQSIVDGEANARKAFELGRKARVKLNADKRHAAAAARILITNGIPEREAFEAVAIKGVTVSSVKNEYDSNCRHCSKICGKKRAYTPDNN